MPATGHSPRAARHAKKGVKVTSEKIKKFGRVLTNSKGRVMYLFAHDTHNTSHCTGACATAWPKVMTTVKPVAGADVKGKHLGKTAKRQATYYGHPLYYFFEDKKAGKDSGEGENSFFLVNVHGKAVKPAKTTKTPTGPTSAAVVSTGAVGTTTMPVVLTTATGETLYALDNPTEPTFFCNSGCTSVWIPLLTKGTPTAEGSADASMLGTINHPGVGTQATYNGDPLYTYTGDTAPGQDAGEGLPGPYSSFDVNEIWYDMLASGTFNTAK
jgi:predicted lipoprotein with Yx(FWY)xxD motif